MSAEEILRSSERSALENQEFVSHVNGKQKSKEHGKARTFGATIFLTGVIVLVAILFGGGNLIPSALSERLLEETDVQYADAVESKKLVFQQAMEQGNLPDNTVEILKKHGVEVGYMEGNDFKAGNQHEGGLVLKMDDKIITANNFITSVSTNVKLYNAFNLATYSRAAYYYDTAAEEVFGEIGTSRNNFTRESDLSEVINSLLGKGNDISVNNANETEKQDSETGETVRDFSLLGAAAGLKSEAEKIIGEVSGKNSASSTEEATLNSADELKTADTIAKEQRSSLFYALLLENISKMKAGDGNESKINEVMNYLYERHETEVVDVETGEVIKVEGSAMDSPSLYAVLSGGEVNMKAAGNYSSDRILKTIQNRLNDKTVVTGTVASAEEKTKGTIGRINLGSAGADFDTLNIVNKTVDGSLVNNSFDELKGVAAGEFLVEGAVNVGKKLALASGATAGDADSVRQYARLNNEVLAMDAAADRENRSPFDITSKNTFLGSILYKVAVMSAGMDGSVMAGVKSFSRVAGSSIMSLIPGGYADAAEGYLTNFGDCETLGAIGAVGSAQCATIETFDTSTLNDTFHNPEFMEFVNENTELSSSGNRTIKQGSELAKFILYNNEKATPVGVMDGGILDSLAGGSTSVPFVSDILKMLRTFMGASEEDKRIASGEAYVNSETNKDWENYKYAQRYVSLARATETLRQYSNGSTAYNKLKFFEGEENPVVAFLRNYYNVAKS